MAQSAKRCGEGGAILQARIHFSRGEFAAGLGYPRSARGHRSYDANPQIPTSNRRRALLCGLRPNSSNLRSIAARISPDTDAGRGFCQSYSFQASVFCNRIEWTVGTSLRFGVPAAVPVRHVLHLNFSIMGPVLRGSYLPKSDYKSHLALVPSIHTIQIRESY